MTALPCGSCGEPAVHVITLRGAPMPVCLRHLNVWRSPADETERGPWVILLLRDAPTGPALPVGYVVEYDADTACQGVPLVTTNDPMKARHFPSFREAWELYAQQSTLFPLREDGQPNRPLTSFHAAVGLLQYAERIMEPRPVMQARTARWN